MEPIQYFYSPPPAARGGGGGHSTKLYTGRLCPEVQTLTLLYTIFDRKVRYPFCIPSVENCNPFMYLRSDFYQTFAKTVKILGWISHQVRLFKIFWKSLLTPKWQCSFLSPFLYFNLWNPYPFYIYLQPEKGTPFGRSLGAFPYNP